MKIGYFFDTIDLNTVPSQQDLTFCEKVTRPDGSSFTNNEAENIADYTLPVLTAPLLAMILGMGITNFTLGTPLAAIPVAMSIVLPIAALIKHTQSPENISLRQVEYAGVLALSYLAGTAVQISIHQGALQGIINAIK